MLLFFLILPNIPVLASEYLGATRHTFFCGSNSACITPSLFHSFLCTSGNCEEVLTIMAFIMTSGRTINPFLFTLATPCKSTIRPRLSTIAASYQECQLKRLFLIESWVTIRGVVKTQVVVGQALSAPNALRDHIAGEPPVRSRCTPPKNEPCSLWIRRADETSERMDENCLVLTPVDVDRVLLREFTDVSKIKRANQRALEEHTHASGRTAKRQRARYL